MKKISILLFVFFGFFSFVFGEEIKNYEVNLFLNKDSSINVEEKIDYDFGNNYKHGIYRFIPNHFQVKGQEKWNGLKERKLKFSDLEVYMDNQKKFPAEKNKNENGNYFIKIGDKDRLITGFHQYKIKYKVEGSLRYFDDYAEIYWNAIGLDWQKPIKKVKVVIKSDGIKFENKACYQGKLNSKEKCNINNNVFESNRVLLPHEGLAVSVSFPKEAVQKVEFWGWSNIGLFAIIFGIAISFIGGIIIFLRRYLNKFKPNKPIIPIYRPYKNYHPALTGYLIDKKFDPQDITAGILFLAQKGIIEIERVEEKGFLFGTNVDYIFRLKKNIEEVEDKLDQMFVRLIFTKTKNIFSSGDVVDILFKKANLNEEVEELNSEVKLSDFSNKSEDLYSQKKSIISWLEQYVKKNKLLESSFALVILVGLIPILVLIIAFFIHSDKSGFVIMILIPMFVFIAPFLKSRYTKQGWEIKNSLDGFKMFLEMTEKERIEMLNAPELNPKEFFEYLPYAVAFGVEKKWKEQFKNITLPQPDWYVGQGPFVANSVLSDISTISSSITSTMKTSASGSSGGGFSGGGSGGGGGGSW